MKLKQEMTTERAEVLLFLQRRDGQIKGCTEIAKERGTRRQAAHKLVKKLEDSGYVEVVSSPTGNIIKLTRAGWSLVNKLGGTDGVVDTDAVDAYELYVKRLHGVVARLQLKNKDKLPADWRASIMERSSTDWVHVEQDGRQFYSAVVDGWTVHLQRESVILYQKHPVEEWTVEASVRELQDRMMRVRDRLVDRIGVELDFRKVDIGRAEFAFEKHHLAMLVDSLPGVELKDVYVEDPEEPGRKEIVFDKSPGVPEKEVKGKDRAVEISNRVQDELRQFQSVEPIEKRHSWENGLVRRGIEVETALDFIEEKCREKSDRVEAADTVGQTHEQIADNYSYDDWNTFG